MRGWHNTGLRRFCFVVLSCRDVAVVFGYFMLVLAFFGVFKFCCFFLVLRVFWFGVCRWFLETCRLCLCVMSLQFGVGFLWSSFADLCIVILNDDLLICCFFVFAGLACLLFVRLFTLFLVDLIFILMVFDLFDSCERAALDLDWIWCWLLTGFVGVGVNLWYLCSVGFRFVRVLL